MIFLGVFAFLAIGMHFKEWLSHPIAHIQGLPYAGAYGIGALHPLVFTVLGYLFLGLVRLTIRGIKRLFKKINKRLTILLIFCLS